MTQKELILLADNKNKEIIEICKKIKKEIKHLPDEYTIKSLVCYSFQLEKLNNELKLIKKILEKS